MVGGVSEGVPAISKADQAAMRKVVISVVGPNTNDDKLLPLGEALGRSIAEAGFVLLTGGRNRGVMDAAAKGARVSDDVFSLPSRCLRVHSYRALAVGTACMNGLHPSAWSALGYEVAEWPNAAADHPALIFMDTALHGSLRHTCMPRRSRAPCPRGCPV